MHSKRFPASLYSKRIGHTDIGTLIKHYAGWIDSATKEQDAKLKEAFKGGGKREKWGRRGDSGIGLGASSLLKGLSPGRMIPAESDIDHYRL
jgi:hypothetical protein